MGYEDYWHSRYDLGNAPSTGLVRLLKELPENSDSKLALDIGCGKGRNFSAIKQRTSYLIGIEPNIAAIQACRSSGYADEVHNSTYQKYMAQNAIHPDLMIGWRVMHLGTFQQCAGNIDLLAQNLVDGGYLAIAVSDRDCPYYGITKSEIGGSEIEAGTIRREHKNDDVRHFFTLVELEEVSDSLRLIAHQRFTERKGGSAHKFKQYHAALYRKCTI